MLEGNEREEGKGRRERERERKRGGGGREERAVVVAVAVNRIGEERRGESGWSNASGHDTSRSLVGQEY